MLLQGFQLDDDTPRLELAAGITVIAGLDAPQRAALALELARAALAPARHPSSETLADPLGCILGAGELEPRPTEADRERNEREQSLRAQRNRWAALVVTQAHRLDELQARGDSRRRLERATSALDWLQQTVQRSALASSDTLGLEALHGEIEAAQAQADRRRRAGNQARIARLRAQERALLERMGFSSWVEYRMASRGDARPDQQLVERVASARAELEDATAAHAEVTALETALAEAREQVAITDATLVLNRPSSRPRPDERFELQVLQHASGLRRQGLPLVLDEPLLAWPTEVVDTTIEMLRSVACELQLVYLTNDARIIEGISGSIDEGREAVIDLRAAAAALDPADIADFLVVHVGERTTHPDPVRAPDPRRDWTEVVITNERPCDGRSAGRCHRCATFQALEPCTGCGQGTCRSCSLVPLRAGGRLCVGCALVAGGLRRHRPARR